MNIPQLPADKAGHLIAGLVVFCIFGLFSPIIGLCAAVVVVLLAFTAPFYNF